MMLQPRHVSRALLLIAVLAMGSRPLSAIDLGKFGTKSDDTDKNAAIEEARRLVNSMNDAATGTITSYEPGHGPKKAEVVTCDEIMAKSLVVANEEKAAITAEKAAVVKAASLLSDRIDELSEKLQEANERIAAAELEFGDLELITQSKLDAAAKEADDRIKEANDAAAEESERMKLNMSALKNSTAVKIERVEQLARQQLEQKDEELNNERRESDAAMNTIRVEAEEAKLRLIKMHHEDLEALREEAAKKEDAHERQLYEVTSAAESEIDAVRQLATEAERAHELQMTEVRNTANSKIATIQEQSARMMKETSAAAEAAVASEAAKHRETLKKLEEAIKEAEEKESKLNSNIAELTTESSSLQNEVTFWKDTHSSQGYCNTTLIREDSRRLVFDALANTKNGLSDTQKKLSDGVKDTGANLVLFIETELIPKVERAMGEACEVALEAYNELSSKALVLYNDHLAATVNAKIVPVFDEHIYPVWNRKAVPLIDQCTEQVSPIVKTIDVETRKKVTKAREGIAPRLESLASSFIEFAQKTNLLDKLPKFISSRLLRAAEDGQWALDNLFYGYLALVMVLFRSTIFRIIWFFCPLRFFFRKQKPAATKKISTNGPSVKAVKTEKNGGKAKIY
eukprot:CAMPEP_0201705990 /NCGR_PEP_ID=MMETSP0578-20130828/47486_1 /ASSEMBLY_ACC=CAM_ASM_000663 /TAXON_ID=267565 /ORGANISM="Skeletonema grethea, Strain CCMP 1804" /LENGTH=629 /DNA_ID=CAMNT_0048194351 /DNA_START=89 /DNA_END=1978 /DNA_ORIENTATION=-